MPLREADVLVTFEEIDNSSGNGDPEEPIKTTVSLANPSSGNIIYYDHREDGYDADIANPVGSNTQIWGDENLANGCAPNVNNMANPCAAASDDYLNAGDVIVLGNNVPHPRGNSVRFDAGDKIGAVYPIAVTRAAWAVGGSDPTGSLLAGAIEVYDTNQWGNSYTAPVGEDTISNNDDPFEYVAMYVMAGPGGVSDVRLNGSSKGQ